MAWDPDSGRSPNRGILFASEYVWRHYHGSLRDIAARWRAWPPEEGEYALDVEERMANDARMRAFEYDQLRAECKALVASGLSGPYVIPV